MPSFTCFSSTNIGGNNNNIDIDNIQEKGSL